MTGKERAVKWCKGIPELESLTLITQERICTKVAKQLSHYDDRYIHFCHGFHISFISIPRVGGVYAPHKQHPPKYYDS